MKNAHGIYKVKVQRPNGTAAEQRGQVQHYAMQFTCSAVALASYDPTWYTPAYRMVPCVYLKQKESTVVTVSAWGSNTREDCLTWAYDGRNARCRRQEFPRAVL